MRNPGITKQLITGAIVSPFKIVKFGADKDHVIQGAAATDALIGVVDIPSTMDAPSGSPVDVVLDGIIEVQYGGTIAAGALVTSDANGNAVAAAPAAGVNNRIIGQAVVDGVTGDIGSILIVQGSIQG